MNLYPIALDLVGRHTLVVGLGSVGRRRAEGLLAAGALVRALDPRPILTEIVPGLTLVRELFRPEHLHDAVLVVAAAPPEVNRAVVQAARAAGVWVNSASDPAEGDFLVPAVWRSGPVVLSVTTTGAGPTLARLLCDRAAAALGPEAAALAVLLAELRPQVLARIPDPAARRRLFRDWADPRWLDQLAASGVGLVRDAMLQALDQAARGA